MRKNLLLKLIRTTLCLNIFCLVFLSAKADWWTDSQNGYDGIPSASSRYKVSYDINNGTIHIESWAYNSRYFVVALGPVAVTGYVSLATLSFSQDGVNYTDFYQFGFNEGGDWTLSGSINQFVSSPYVAAKNLCQQYN